MKIKSLAKTTFDTIFEAFNQAFADYELQLNKAQLQGMLTRRGFNLDLSFAAFDGSRMVSFTFNGIGNFGEVPTAYDTGTGTLKEYRGKGLATEVFEYSIPFLKEKGIEQYLLEVLQHNTTAVSVYKNIGFEVVRNFGYYNQKNEAVNNEVKTPDTSISIKPIGIEDIRSVEAFWDFYPSWQNSFESIERAYDEFVCLGGFIEERLVGYCVFEPTSGDITQLAVDKQYRRKGIASLLLDNMLKLNKHNSIKAVNTDVSCASIAGFFEAKNIAMQGKQFEMAKKL